MPGIREKYKTLLMINIPKGTDVRHHLCRDFIHKGEFPGSLVGGRNGQSTLTYLTLSHAWMLIVHCTWNRIYLFNVMVSYCNFMQIIFEGEIGEAAIRVPPILNGKIC